MKTISRISTSLIALTFFLCSCSGVEEAEKDHAWASTPITLTKAQGQISNDINTFGFKTFDKMCGKSASGDIFFSPLSLSLDLSMCALGASGQTAEQMSSVLGFDRYTPEEIASYFEKVAGGLERVDNKTTFTSANSIWFDNSLSVKSTFEEMAGKYFNAEIFSVDFGNASTIDKINNWASNKTNGLIPKMVDKIDPQVVLSLFNAIYFKGKWSFDFDSKLDKGKFHGATKNYTVDYMTVKRSMRYKENELFQLCYFSYGQNRYHLVVVLPKEGVSLESVTEILASGEYTLFAGTSACEVTAKLPQFKIDYTADNLKEILEEMGMTLPFSSAADFSNTSDVPLFITDVTQKASIDVNRHGTEAAAVTKIDEGIGLSDYNPDSASFIADHPFLFFIYEQGSGTVVFAGRKM